MIVSLTPQDVNRVWLVAQSHYTNRMLVEHISRHPHLAWMVQESGDYIVGAYWKNRPEIGLIMESSPSPQRSELVHHLLESYARSGTELVILSDHEVSRALRLYQDWGFAILEQVICYEKPDMRIPVVERRLTVQHLVEEDLPALVELERATFPWLWWETADSFLLMDGRPDTLVLTAHLGAELVGYLVLAVRADWGYVNRIGVHPRRQGQGFGLELLTVAVEELARRGACSVGLNTQSDNLRSQKLYEHFGFFRTGESFKIHGKWLGRKTEEISAKE